VIIRELITKLGYQLDETQLNKYANKTKQVSKNLRNVGKRMSLFVTLPILGATGAMVKAASEAEEVGSKFSVVFSKIENDANKAAKNLRNNYGLASSSAKNLLANTADLLTGFEFSQETALELSEQVQQLSVDLASFQNVQGGAEEVSRKLTKGMLGEFESLKLLGVAINKDVIAAEKLKLAQEGITFASEQQAKAYAVLRIAQRQSKNAIGDFQRTQDQFANSWRVMVERLKEAAIGFGKILLPAATRVLVVVKNAIKFVADLSPGMKRIILVVVLLVAALGPLLTIAGAILALVPAIIAGATVAGGAISAAIWPITLITAAIVALIAVGALLMQDIETWAKGGDSLLGRWLGSFQNFKNGVMAIWNTLLTVGRFVLKTAIDLVMPFIKSIWQMFSGLFKVLGGLLQVFGGILTLNVETIVEGLKNIFKGLLDFIIGFAKTLFHWIIFPFRQMFVLANNLAEALGTVTGKAGGIGGVLKGIGNFLTGAGNIGAGIGGGEVALAGAGTTNNTTVGGAKSTNIRQGDITINAPRAGASAEEIANTVGMEIDRRNRQALAEVPEEE